jgi:hypothetical protein
MPRLKPCLMPYTTMHSRLFSCAHGPHTERRCPDQGDPLGDERALGGGAKFGIACAHPQRHRAEHDDDIERLRSEFVNFAREGDAASSFTSGMLVKSPAEGRARLCDGSMRGRVCSGICPSVSLLPRLSSARILPLGVRVEICTRSDGIGPPAVLCQFWLAQARRAMADEEQQQKSQDSGRTANDKFRYWRPDPLHQWDIELIEKALHAVQAEGAIYIGRDRASSRCVHRPISTSSISLERQQFNQSAALRRALDDLRHQHVAIWQTAMG